MVMLLHSHVKQSCYSTVKVYVTQLIGFSEFMNVQYKPQTREVLLVDTFGWSSVESYADTASFLCQQPSLNLPHRCIYYIHHYVPSI